MDNFHNTEILNLKHQLIDDLTDYMEYGGAEDENDPDYDPEFDAGYTQEQVDNCAVILESFLDTLANLDTPAPAEEIMAAVKTAVLALNALNEQCDGAMIETEQREKLCELIISAAKTAGLDSEEDITEEWREW